jgi:tetratricopeptide (TPR) repeat protein
MKLRHLAAVAVFASLAFTAGGDELTPRELWRDAAASASAGDLKTAADLETKLINTGKAYGVATYPLYAQSAAALARIADKQKRQDVAEWATKTAEQLDPKSPAVAFSNADRMRDQRNWKRLVPALFAGYTRVFGNYRTRLLSRTDLLVVLILALALTIAIFSASLFIRYGRSMSHDFREFLSERFRGGSVSVLAFALLFLPIFIWLSPVWLIFYWFAIFFAYADRLERALIIVFALILAALPIATDRAATWAAGVDGPVVLAATAAREQSYQPEALRRMEELAALVPDNYIVHLLLGNLELQEGNERDAQIHYRRSNELHDNAGAHVNLGNINFLDNDFQAAITEYEKAVTLDPKLAIAYYNNSVAAGELYHYDEQGQKLDKAKSLDRAGIERLAQSPPSQKIAIYDPPIEQAWSVQEMIARKGAAKSIFGTYPYFDPSESAINSITIGALLSAILAVWLWFKRRKSGLANACIKCGRTFCHRCKSARESATYCTQCIHIYLKRDGVSLDTKRSKLEEVHEHHTGMVTRNRLLTTFFPGSAQVLEGRTVVGVLGMFVFIFFAAIAVLTGRLAPALGPVAETAQLVVRAVAALIAVVMWFLLSMPVYRRKAAV